MVVALSTANRCPHPDLQRRVDTIDDRRIAKLFVVRSAFAVGECVPVKSGRDELILCRLRQQVSRKLLDRKLVERLVAVERADHPVAIQPDRSFRIVGVARRVCVASQVQPHRRPAFAVRVRREQFVNQFFVSLRIRVIHKPVSPLDRWRESRQVETESSDERVPIRLGSRPQPLGLKPFQHESINPVSDSLFVLYLG